MRTTLKGTVATVALTLTINAMSQVTFYEYAY